MNIITIRGIKKSYKLGKTSVEALRGIDLDIEQGDFIAIAGPSGSGKTTLLNLIGLMDNPTSGAINLFDKDVSKLNDKEMTDLRQKTIGFIFQSFNLIPVLNVWENIEFPLYFGRNKAELKARKEWIGYLIERVGLQDHIRHKPAELSGGQRQRVAIARALVNEPAIVMADEPTANLDSKTAAAIIELMKEINREKKTTFIFSTHDQNIVSIADHEVRLLDGQIVENKRR